MSEKESGPTPDIPVNPLLEKLMTDGRAAGLVTMQGYIGRSSETGIVTLHPSLNDISLSIEIARGDIVQFTQAAESELPHSGTVLWVTKDAKVTVRSVVRVRADELAGVARKTLSAGAALGTVAESPEDVTELRKGRLRIQMPNASEAKEAICHGGTCVSVCNCRSTCCVLRPPT
ncbi:hypothetical protein GCM10009527_096340 [Actinomadura nitritigenes]|uniref:Uncharacterized protein n=1 Tax=Actinomadura nitritigenes TaxID=134602 RepID=A0ABS3RHT6_9ACTN|nr:hypothetical protein [Actinomadura nitritigenes]MBO2445447.1 hypothetical protein [Actinomadura nitritigenes]